MDAFVQRRIIRKSKTRADSPAQNERPVKRGKPNPGRSQPDKLHNLGRDEDNLSSCEGSEPEQSEYRIAEEADGDENLESRDRHTTIEDSLPPMPTDAETLETYEAAKASEISDSDGTTGRTEPPWTRGKSSIYVDAFNYALDTVLEDESHLFDAKEHAVFDQWRQLDYEAQYL